MPDPTWTRSRKLTAAGYIVAIIAAAISGAGLVFNVPGLYKPTAFIAGIAFLTAYAVHAYMDRRRPAVPNQKVSVSHQQMIANALDELERSTAGISWNDAPKSVATTPNARQEAPPAPAASAPPSAAAPGSNRVYLGFADLGALPSALQDFIAVDMFGAVPPRRRVRAEMTGAYAVETTGPRYDLRKLMPGA